MGRDLQSSFLVLGGWSPCGTGSRREGNWATLGVGPVPPLYESTLLCLRCGGVFWNVDPSSCRPRTGDLHLTPVSSRRERTMNPFWITRSV